MIFKEFLDQNLIMDIAIDSRLVKPGSLFFVLRGGDKFIQDAINNDDKVEQLDALIDILVVTIGAIHSMGALGEDAWNEVMRTNFAKIDSETGKVRKREDGKVLKPEGWKSPELEQYLLFK